MTFDDIDTTIVPTRNDVLCGKGIVCSLHPGNQHYHALIQRHVPKYARSRRAGKSEIVRRIIDDIVVRNKGRFLRKTKKDPIAWQHASERAVREKVSHSLRDGAALYTKNQPIMTPATTKSKNNKTMVVETKRTVQKRAKRSTKSKALCSNATTACCSHQTTCVAMTKHTTTNTKESETIPHGQSQQQCNLLEDVFASHQDTPPTLSFEEPTQTLAQWAEAFLNDNSSDTDSQSQTNDCQQPVSPTTSNDDQERSDWQALSAWPLSANNDGFSPSSALEVEQTLANDSDEETEAMYQKILQSLEDETPGFELSGLAKDLYSGDFDLMDVCEDL